MPPARHPAHGKITWPFLALAYHLELALACLEAFEFAPAKPRFEPEVDPIASARRRTVISAGMPNGGHRP